MGDTIYSVDPCEDPRWLDLIWKHPAATAFHHPGWLAALRAMYNYPVMAFTTTPPSQPLTNGLPFCLVTTLLTNSRLISLPFTDHLSPLESSVEESMTLLKSCERMAGVRGCRYVELRPASPSPFMEDLAFKPSRREVLHRIDLRPSIEELHKALNYATIRRKINRAGNEGLRFETGTSDELLDDFYGLMVRTRRRHGVPPQPRAWFRTVLSHLPDVARLRLAYAGRTPIAAMFTLEHGSSFIYKYAASDPERSQTGAAVLLVWQAIQYAKQAGYRWFDMGRTDAAHTGLATYKERWGAQPSPLIYYSCPPPEGGESSVSKAIARLSMPIVRRMPTSLFVLMGRVLYRHVG